MPAIIITNPVQPSALPSPATNSEQVIPHVQMPFSLMASGRASYCDQGSTEDVASQVLNVVSCPQGANPYDDTFGRPDLVGSTVPLNLTALTEAVRAQVPMLEELDATQAFTVVGDAVQISLTGTISGDSPQ